MKFHIKMDGIQFKIEGELVGKFEKTAKEMPIVEKRALYRAAWFLRDKIRNEIISKVPKSTVTNPRYTDTLVDAVGFTRPDGGSLVVNALGTRRPGSGTFRTRFFEAGTQDRYQKTRNGIKLRKKKFIGRLKAHPFFQSTVSANEQGAVEQMREIITKYVNETLNG